jgi:hypothetical protein
MRSFKSSIYRYGRRQARREVYKVYDAYRKNKYTKPKEENKTEEITMSDFLISVGVVFGIIFFFSSL